MKKLNNQGWGFGTMIFLMTILVIFFVIAIYFIWVFYNSFEIPETKAVNAFEIRRQL